MPSPKSRAASPSGYTECSPPSGCFTALDPSLLIRSVQLQGPQLSQPGLAACDATPHSNTPQQTLGFRALRSPTHLPLWAKRRPARRPILLQRPCHGEQHCSSKCLDRGDRQSALERRSEPHLRASVPDCSRSSAAPGQHGEAGPLLGRHQRAEPQPCPGREESRRKATEQGFTYRT